MRTSLVHRLAALAVAASVAAACGSSSSKTASSNATTTTAPAFPVTLRTKTGDVAIPAQPKRIVSLSATATETLFAIGAGSQVVAVDKYSNYPSQVPKGDIDALATSPEAVAAKQPDLVVLSNDRKGLGKGLTALKIPVLVEEAPTTLDRMYAEIAELGQATGHSDGATTVAGQIKDGLAKVAATTKAQGVSYYYELDPTYYSQTSRTFLGQVLGTIGLVNIADKAQATSDYPQLSAEFVVKADPDLVLLADTKCCAQNESTVATRAGWATMKAVRLKQVVALDDDIASRWGPRIVELLQQVAAAASKAKSAS